MPLIDAHVHIYDCFHLETFFDSAYINFATAAERIGRRSTGILLLAETSKDHWFDHLSNYADGKELPQSKNTGKWSLHRTGDVKCLEARAGERQQLYLIAGRQIVTQEGLEVLGLVTTTTFVDGRPLKEVLESVKEIGAIPVIPWGFGKWTGARGRVLEEVLAKEPMGQFFLGDNGGRTGFLGEPGAFEKGREKGFRILPGSDPLPFSVEQGRAGSYGLMIEGRVSAEHPTQDLIESLRNPALKCTRYGKLENPLLFLFKQCVMQIRKRGRRG